MKFNKFGLFVLLLVFSGHSFALAVDDWEYRVFPTGNQALRIIRTDLEVNEDQGHEVERA